MSVETSISNRLKEIIEKWKGEKYDSSYIQKNTNKSILI